MRCENYWFFVLIYLGVVFKNVVLEVTSNTIYYERRNSSQHIYQIFGWPMFE